MRSLRQLCPPKSQFRAVSSTDGRIKKLLVSLPANICQTRQLHEHFASLFSAMKNCDCEFVIVALSMVEENHDVNCRDVKGEVEQISRATEFKGRISIIPMFVNRPRLAQLEAWVQDYFIVLTEPSNGLTILGEPLVIKTNSDYRYNEYIPDIIAANLGYLLMPVLWNVVGGDILIGDNFAIVGDTILKESFGASQSSRRLTGHEAEQFLKRFLGVKQIVWCHRVSTNAIGRNDQFTGSKCVRLLGHIDRYITLAGMDTEHSHRQLVYVAEIKKEYCVPYNAVETTIVKSIACSLDRLACGFEQYNDNGLEFKVRRLPMIVEHYRVVPPHFRSFNNCLIEVYKGGRNVYVPIYKASTEAAGRVFEYAEQEMQQAFKDRNFSVHRIGGEFPAVLGRGGALRCAVKVLERSPW